MTEKIKKIVLAYSGGLDTSVMLRWLKEQYGCEVICYCADVGQGDELSGLEAKALRTGGSKLYVEDLREEFVREYVWTAVKANAVYEGVYLLGTSLARPVIAKRQIEIARREGADAVAHGATGKGNDQVRFELTYYALQPDIKVIAPWREWEFKGRSDLIAYAKDHNIPVTATHAKPYSTDANLMHISYEGGILEDPWAEPPEDIFQLTRSPVVPAHGKTRNVARSGRRYMSDSSMRTNPSIDDPSNMILPSSASSNCRSGISTFLIAPRMSVNCRRMNLTFSRSVRSRICAFVSRVVPAGGWVLAMSQTNPPVIVANFSSAALV